MVDKELLTKYKAILSQLENMCGTTILFAIFKMDEMTDKWTIILSAPWVNESNFKDIYFKLRDISANSLSTRELQQVGRVGIFRPDNHLIKEIIEKYDGTNHEIQEEKVNGNFIHEGYILNVNENLWKDFLTSSSNKNQEKLL